METGANQFSLPHWLRIVLIGRNPKWTLVRTAVTVIALVSLFKFVLLPIRVEGPSILPTYQNRGLNFVNRLAYARTDPKRGDVVAIRYSGTHTMLINTVIALPR